MGTTSWIHPFERTGLGKAPFKCVGFSVMKFQACPDAPVQPGSSCDHCGTGIMNVFFIQGADGSRFKVGIDCVKKTLDTALRAEARKVAAQERARVTREHNEKVRAERMKTAVPDFLATNPGLEEALACGHEITNDLAAKLRQYGNLSAAQVELAFKLYAETFAPMERPEVDGYAPINDGKRQTIRGRIVSVKDYESPYGTQWKMTIKIVEQRPDANYVWLCWGSVPQIKNRPYGVDIRNHEIEFTASLKPGRESNFALFSRPTKARLVNIDAPNSAEQVAA